MKRMKESLYLTTMLICYLDNSKLYWQLILSIYIIIPICLLMSILMSILMPVLMPILMFILSILLWFDRALLCKDPEERWRLWWLRVRVPISGLFKTTTTLTSEDVGWGMGKTYPSWTLVLKLKERKNLVTLDFGSHIWVARRAPFMQHCANYIFRYLIGWAKMP